MVNKDYHNQNYIQKRHTSITSPPDLNIMTLLDYFEKQILLIKLIIIFKLAVSEFGYVMVIWLSKPVQI